MFDVITIGSSTIDVFIDTDSELIKIKTKKGEEDLIAYPAGSKILIKKLNFTTGGGGTNTAVSMSRLGLKVGYLGKIGSDETGHRIRELLKTDKVSFVGVREIGGISGYSIILDSVEHDRTILTYKGCCNDLNFREIKINLLKARWFYASSMMGESFKTLEKLVEYAKRKGIWVAFNPSCYLAEKGKKYLSKVIKNTDVLILNKEEAKLLTGKNIRDSLINLRKLGPTTVVITDGKNGIHAYDGEYMYNIKAHKMKVVESTGAGDAFGSSFIAGMIRKDDIEFALKLGMTNAESVIAHHGAKNNLLRWDSAVRKMIIKQHTVTKKRL